MLKSHLKIIAENIRKERLIKNYSQDYLAARLSISQNAYSKIELGYTRVTVERVIDIAEILEIDVLLLLGQDKTGTLTRQIRSAENAEKDWMHYYNLAIHL